MVPRLTLSLWFPTLAAVVMFAPLAAQADSLRALQAAAEDQRRADWGHWGSNPNLYNEWSTHSNRLIPVYTFGLKLDALRKEGSVYRDQARLAALYSAEPEGTLNPQAEYFDQTDIYRLQQQAVAAGKKYIVLVIFDGMDWHTTRAAAVYYSGKVGYTEGRGSGLLVQDYRGAPTDFGFFVSSPYRGAMNIDVDAQRVLNVGEPPTGGYDAKLGGATPWSNPVDLPYLISRNLSRPHTTTDSAASATSLMSGVKTYNNSINFDRSGNQVAPIARDLQQRGFAVGVVTSVPISHATPAAAYANNVTRADYQDVARDLLGEPSIAHRETALPGLDVVLGAGWGVTAQQDAGQGQNFEPGNPYIAESTLSRIDAGSNGPYRVVMRQSGAEGGKVLLQAARQAAHDGQRLFGMFGTPDGNLPFRTADGNYDPTIAPAAVRSKFNPGQGKFNPDAPYTKADIRENPTLADMTVAALTVLSKRDRFWLMIEAGDVDWASHGNNIDNAVGAIKSGDEAIGAVFRWIESRDAWDQSAVIVTSDHGHLLVLPRIEALVKQIQTGQIQTGPK